MQIKREQKVTIILKTSQLIYVYEVFGLFLCDIYTNSKISTHWNYQNHLPNVPTKRKFGIK